VWVNMGPAADLRICEFAAAADLLHHRRLEDKADWQGALSAYAHAHRDEIATPCRQLYLHPSAHTIPSYSDVRREACLEKAAKLPCGGPMVAQVLRGAGGWLPAAAHLPQQEGRLLRQAGDAGGVLPAGLSAETSSPPACKDGRTDRLDSRYVLSGFAFVQYGLALLCRLCGRMRD
jgi:hypothetical protein